MNASTRTSVPGSSAGRKLGIKPGARLALAGAPEDFEATLGDPARRGTGHVGPRPGELLT